MNEIERFDVLIFGSGAGGKLTAWTSASEGLRTAVVERGLIGVSDETSRTALKLHPDRFIPSGNVSDPNDVIGTVRSMRREYEEFGIRAE